MKSRRKRVLKSKEKRIEPAEEKKAAPPACQYPWLVYSDGERYANQSFYSLRRGAPPIEIYCGRIPALEQKRVLSFSYGWLVLYDYANQLFCLCNCTTFDTTLLPKMLLGPPKIIDSCILSSSPDNPDCKVLLFLQNYQSIIYCQLGGNGWSEIRYKNQLIAQNVGKYLSFYNPVTCGGKIYANLRGCKSRRKSRELWSVEIIHGDAEQMVLSRLGVSLLVEESIVESDGELYCVKFTLSTYYSKENREIIAVDLGKLSCDGMEWERVNTLKNRSFFICPDYSFSCQTPGQDCIFITRSGDMSLYAYNLEEESLCVTTLPGPIQNYPIWMMPQILIMPEDCCIDRQVDGQLLDLGKNGDEEKNLLMNLPPDIFEEIKKLITPHDYLNIRSLSRMCRLVAPLISWRKALSGFEAHISFPLHMFALKCRSLYRFVDPHQNSAQGYLMTFPDRLKNASLVYSNDGWLLMTGESLGALHLHLFNPFTRDIRSYNLFTRDICSGNWFIRACIDPGLPRVWFFGLIPQLPLI